MRVISRGPAGRPLTVEVEGRIYEIKPLSKIQIGRTNDRIKDKRRRKE